MDARRRPDTLNSVKTCCWQLTMNVVFFATRVPDLCGAFLHDIDLAIELQNRGHSVVWMTLDKPPQGVQGGTYRGFRFMHFTAGTSFLESSEVWICPHAPALPGVRRVNARGFDRPIIATCHFDGRYQTITSNGSNQWKEMLFFINQTMESAFRKNIVPWPSYIVRTGVVRPILHEFKIKMDSPPDGDCITLVNANVNKGVHQFIAIAKAMPEKRFLGVLPYYGELWVPQGAPGNLEWTPFDDDIRNILKRTRILLMPSYSESFGRIAVEAMYNGIPVLYTKPIKNVAVSTDGMEEWITPAGIPCEREKIEEWVAAIETLDDQDVYAAKSEEVKEHVQKLDFFTEAPKIAEQVEQFVRENPVIVQKSLQVQQARSVQDATAAPTLRPTQPTGRVGLVGGRLKLR